MLSHSDSIAIRLYRKLLGIVTDRGGQEHDLQKLSVSKARRPITKVADAIVGFRGPTKEGTFPMTVDHRQSFQELLHVFDRVDREIRKEYFPRPNETVKLELELFHPDDEMLPREVIAECKKRGQRQATTWEQMVFAEWYAEWHRKEKITYPIVALGSPWQHGREVRSVSVIYAHPNGQRELRKEWFDNARHRFHRYLVVKNT